MTKKIENKRTKSITVKTTGKIIETKKIKNNNTAKVMIPNVIIDYKLGSNDESNLGKDVNLNLKVN